jgi:hypothetical protein
MDNEFNLERAIAGEPIETVMGTPVEFIAYRPTAKTDEQLIVQDGANIRMYHANGILHSLFSPCFYDLRMKSVLKQIDWTKLPVDTLLIIGLGTGNDARYFSSFSNGMVRYYRGGMTSKTVQNNSDIFATNPSNVKIAPNQPWTVWLGGGCPIPDGLEFEYIANNEIGYIITCKENARGLLWTHYSIYAYRLTGKVLDGWEL